MEFYNFIFSPLGFDFYHRVYVVLIKDQISPSIN